MSGLTMDLYEQEAIDTMLKAKADTGTPYAETYIYTDPNEGYEEFCEWLVRFYGNKPIYVRLKASFNENECDHVYTEDEIDAAFNAADNSYDFKSYDFLASSAWAIYVSADDGSIFNAHDGYVFITEKRNLYGGTAEETCDKLAETMTGGEVSDASELFSSKDTLTDPDLANPVLNNPVLEKGIIKVFGSLFH